MAPQRIMFIRHAEKPYDKDDVGIDQNKDAKKDDKGVTSKGDVDKESLIVRGWQRAGALVRFFCPNPENHQYPMIPPDTIFACAFGDGGGGSRRPRETVKPLVKMLTTAEFVTTFYRDQHKEVMDAVLSRNGTVLVAWEHKAIPVLVGLIPGAPAVPQHWPGDRFDIAWVFDRTETNWSFSQWPQLLLAGDSPDPIPF
jgi:hypothetical protein